jgi:hypothetical protein
MDRARSSKSPNGSLGGGFHITFASPTFGDQFRQIPAAARMPPAPHSMIRKATAGSCRRSPQDSRTHQRHRFHGHRGIPPNCSGRPRSGTSPSGAALANHEPIPWRWLSSLACRNLPCPRRTRHHHPGRLFIGKHTLSPYDGEPRHKLRPPVNPPKPTQSTRIRLPGIHRDPLGSGPSMRITSPASSSCPVAEPPNLSQPGFCRVRPGV